MFEVEIIKNKNCPIWLKDKNNSIIEISDNLAFIGMSKGYFKLKKYFKWQTGYHNCPICKHRHGKKEKVGVLNVSQG